MFGKRKGLFACMSAITLAGVMGVSSAKASLVFSLEATTLNGIAVADSKTVTIGGVGDVIGYNVYATITTGTAANDTLTSAAGDIISTGGIKGTLTHAVNSGSLNATAGSVSANFATGVFNNGAAGADLDGDTDNDIGAVLVGGHPANTGIGVINYLAASPIAGTKFLLGSGTFTVTGTGADTVLNFSVGTLAGLNKNPLWVEAGASFNQQTGTVGTSSGITVTSVPEPASLGLLGLGVMGLLARRRK